MKNICKQEKIIIQLIFNLGLASTRFLTTRPCLQQVNQTWARDPNENQHLIRGPLEKKNTRDLVEL